MHNCETAPLAPPATGAQLLLELGKLIIHSRSPSPTPTTSTPLSASFSDASPEDGYGRLLQAKLLAARSLTPELPSTSKESSEDIIKRTLKIKDLEGWKTPQAAPGLDAAAVGEAVTKAQRALYLDSLLNSHVQALWSERVPICIDVLLTSACRQRGGAGGCGETLLLERWTLSVKPKKSVEKPSFITSQWLLNAVRSQLHFSQITAWRAKLKNTADPTTDPQERQRRRSRETCNYKKLESNCDEEELVSGHEHRDDKEVKRLNVVYRPRLGGDLADFPHAPSSHRFPLTDIAADLFLDVLLESLPRSEDIPTVKCTCSAAPKRRTSKDNTIHEELASRMNDLSLGPPDDPKHFRSRGATFSPDLGLINSNTGCTSGFSRRLSIFSGDYNGTRVSTPERQFYDSGYPESGSPSKDRKSIQLDHPYFNRNLSVKSEVRANYLLVDDRMHTPCSENGKHRCSCDDESDHGKEFNPRSSTSLVKEKEDKKVLDERRLKEIAKYKRRLRKESKLKKLRESGTSDSGGTSESADRSPEKDKEETAQTTSIPILQASRFDRMRTIGCYRNQTYLTLPANRSEERSYGEAARDTVRHPPTQTKKTVVSIATQTDHVRCLCGRRVHLECDECRRRMVRSEASYDLTRVEAPELSPKVCARRKEMDDVICDEKVMKKHKCDNKDRNLKCDLSFSNLKESGIRKCPDDDSTSSGIIKRPKLRRVLPLIERIANVVTDRRKAEHAASDIDELLLKDDDSVFACLTPAPTDERSPLTRNRSSVSDDEYFLYEKCDYGTFDRFDNPEALVQDSDDDKKDPDIPEAEGVGRHSELQTSRRIKGLDVPEVPSPSEMEGFRWRLDSAASMVFHARTGLPLTSSPAPLRRGKSCFDYDSSITDISGIKSALFHPVSPPEGWWSPGSSPGSPAPLPASPPPQPASPPPRRQRKEPRVKMGVSSGLLGSFEESALNGRLEPVATVHGFTAELGASGAFCPPHRRLPVTVFFYALGGTNAPYLGHINLGGSGYHVPRSGTVQVSLFNPHGTLVKMFVVLYELTDMPASARTFLRQRTLYLPCDVTHAPPPHQCHRWLRYLIHLRFLTSKTGKLYLHTDIRIIVSRKADLDTATAHSPIYNNPRLTTGQATNPKPSKNQPTNQKAAKTNHEESKNKKDIEEIDTEKDNNGLAVQGKDDTNSIKCKDIEDIIFESLDKKKTTFQRIDKAELTNLIISKDIIQTSHSKYEISNSKNLPSESTDHTSHSTERTPDLIDRIPDSTDQTSVSIDQISVPTNRIHVPTNASVSIDHKSALESRSARPETVNRVFGGCEDSYEVEQKYDYNSAKSDRDFLVGRKMNRSEACMELKAHCDDESSQRSVSYELRSFTYAPENPKYSPL